MKRFRDSYYLVTIDGKVWSERSNKFLSPYMNDDGYYRIALYINGKQKMMLLHRVIAECWIPNPDDLPIVNHKDFDKSNCHVTNLEWSTISDNNVHAINNGLHRRLSDELNGMSVCIECLEDDEWTEYPSSATLARKLGVHRSSITRALKNNRTICGYNVRYKSN